MTAWLAGCASTDDWLEQSKSEDASDRREALVGLGEELRAKEGAAAPRDDVQAALMAGLDDPDPSVRATAVDGLGALGQPAAIPGLLKAAKDRHVRVRAAALRQLARLKATEAFEIFVKALSRDEPEDLRREAIHGLTTLGDPRALEPLIEALEKDPSRLRFAAHDALRRLSGENLPPSAREWRNWYAQRGK